MAKPTISKSAIPGPAVPGFAIPGSAISGLAIPGPAIPEPAVPGSAIPELAIPGLVISSSGPSSPSPVVPSATLSGSGISRPGSSIPRSPGPAVEASPPYDREAIFHDDGPFNPVFMTEATRALVRCLPIDPDEPPAWARRRIFAALLGLSALHPRDEIEVMLGVQAMSAYHAAAACWRIGMNLRCPNGDSTRHLSAAASAARVYDSMLRALERRQAKPLSIPIGRPPPREWNKPNMTKMLQGLEDRARFGEFDEAAGDMPNTVVWTAEDVAIAVALREQIRTESDHEGLDIANTDGILPGGGMIMSENPTPQQVAYMSRRIGLMYRREHEENLRIGIKKMPKIRAIRPGDLIP